MKKIFLSLLVFILTICTISITYSFEVKQVSREEIDKIKCDLNFKWELEKWYNYTFHDTFINSWNREVKVIESEINIYEEEDFNQSNFFSEANFSSWSLEKDNIYIPWDRWIITELNDNYKIAIRPKQSKQDNFIIKYTLNLYYKWSDWKFSDWPYPHTECKQYKIIWEETEDEIEPACKWIVLNKTFWINKLTTKATCRFSDITNYKIDCWNWDISIWKIGKIWDWEVIKTCIYNKPWNYNISCIVDNEPVKNFCKKEVFVKKETLDEKEISSTYNKYKIIKDRIKEIIFDENKKWKRIIQSPKVLPKTWTPILEKTNILENKKIDTVIKKERFILSGSTNRSLDFWKKVLDKRDRNAKKYIVIPSSGLIIPINNINENTSDYKKIISWKEIELNKYLKTGVMEYPWTSTKWFWEIWNKVIFWHSSYWKKDDWRYKTDFGKIIELDPNEEIWIYIKNNSWKYRLFRYKVEDSYNTTDDDIWVLNPWIWKNISLITCTPIWWIAGRWIIKAKFIDEEKIELEKRIWFNSIGIKLKIKINNIVKRVWKNKKTVLKIFNSIIKKEKEIYKLKETKKIKQIKVILEYLKYKLALEYYK